MYSIWTPFGEKAKKPVLRKKASQTREGEPIRKYLSPFDLAKLKLDEELGKLGVDDNRRRNFIKPLNEFTELEFLNMQIFAMSLLVLDEYGTLNGIAHRIKEFNSDPKISEFFRSIYITMSTTEEPVEEGTKSKSKRLTEAELFTRFKSDLIRYMFKINSYRSGKRVPTERPETSEKGKEPATEESLRESRSEIGEVGETESVVSSIIEEEESEEEREIEEEED